MPGVWRHGGHLGPSVSALVDGQLDERSTERAWAHVMRCPSCRRAVEHEGWVKRRLAQMGGSLDSGDEPSSRLLGSLHDLDPVAQETREAWAAVGELEQRGRGRRRAAVAAVGVGSVSAAVLGLGALGGTPLGVGQAPAGSPVTSLTRSTATTAGPLSQPGAAGGAATAVSTASSGFVPFSGWSVSAPVAARALATTSRTPR
jgi:hypothetical protein